MQSLIVDKQNLVKRLDNVMDELNFIKNEIIKDIDLSDIEMTQDIKESRFKESEQTLKSKRKTYMSDDIEKPNRGYTDFYDINSRPDIKI